MWVLPTCKFSIRESKHKSIVSTFINSFLDIYHMPGSISTANKETYNLIHNYNTTKEVIAHQEGSALEEKDFHLLHAHGEPGTALGSS